MIPILIAMIVSTIIGGAYYYEVIKPNNEASAKVNQVATKQAVPVLLKEPCIYDPNVCCADFEDYCRQQALINSN
jgi:hypothetical protein